MTNKSGKSYKSGTSSNYLDVDKMRSQHQPYNDDGEVLSHRSSNDDNDRRRHSRLGKKDLIQ